jgi:EpsI family protein
MRLASLLLLVEIALSYVTPAGGRPIAGRLFENFPTVLNEWRMTQEFATPADMVDLLKADAILNRSYARLPDADVGLFVAYFDSPKAGMAPHSPKVCLPSAGWTAVESGVISLPIPGRTTPVSVSRYRIQRGEDEILILYWYQTYTRMAASEYGAKFSVILDSLRYRRNDTTFVRVAVPVRNGREAAERSAIEFVQAIFPPLQQRLPGGVVPR